MSVYTYSIVIPHYNTPELLQRMLDSVPQRADIQIIVVDDCSNVNNLDKLKKISHSNLEIVYLSENHGAGYARNIGLKKITGEWLLVVDADDYFANNAFSVFDQYVHTQYDYICYRIKGLDSNMREYEIVADKNVREYINDRNKLLAFKYLNLVCWNKLVNVGFIQENDIHFEECQVNNDVLYNLIIGFKAKQFKVISDVLYYNVVNENSITNQKRTLEKEFMFYIQAEKRNGFYEKIGLKYYPFYRHKILYFPYMVKKRGLLDAIKFFKIIKKRAGEIKEARKAYLYLFDN